MPRPKHTRRTRRQPGESSLWKSVEQALVPVVVVAGIAIGASLTVAAGWAWLIAGLPLKWFAIVWPGMCIMAAVAVYWRNVKMIDRFGAGIRGERIVADAIEMLAPLGYRAFHDLPDTTADGAPCNIDHVLVGPEGVFVLETKYRDKARHRNVKIEVLPNAILLSGHPIQPDPRGQAAACAASVKRHLKRRLGREIPVKAVVVFPRWYTVRGFSGEVWVLSETSVVSTLKVSRYEQLSAQEIEMIVTELDDWSREPEPSPVR